MTSLNADFKRGEDKSSGGVKSAFSLKVGAMRAVLGTVELPSS